MPPSRVIPWSGKGHLYDEADIAAVAAVMRDADPLTQGGRLKAFEADFAALIGRPHCFGLTNCAHALELSAILSRIGPGDEVAVPAHTYCASAIPFARAGARLTWTDIEPDTFVVSARTIERALTPRTRAIVVVHLYGMICPDIADIAALARDRGLFLIEDCAQSLGARLDGRAGGDFGDFGCYSFHAQKNLTTLGEGGMLSVRDPELARLVPGLRHNGHAPFADQTDYWKPAMTDVAVDIPGVWPHNYSLSEAQAALGSSLLRRLDALTAARRARGLAFRAALADRPELAFQKIGQPEAHSHHLLPARFVPAEARDDFIRLMSREWGVKTIVQYRPLHRYDLFRANGFGEADCPEAERFFDSMVSFPFHVWMSDDDFAYMIEATRGALDRLSR